jgi:hypothetical protein
LGVFDWLFGSRVKAPTRPACKRYEFPTGNIEFAIRVQNGEPLFEVIQDIKPRWTPGNEYLWDECDAESLIDSDEKRSHVVNCLLYGRVIIYRALLKKGKDVRGNDPFAYFKESQEQVQYLQVMFPRLFPGAFEGKLPPVKLNAILLPDTDFPPSPEG